MTTRERFRQTMAYGTPDRVPYFEEGLRDDVLERWHEQGLPAGTELADLFPTDRRERIPVNLEPLPPLEKWPASRDDLDDLRQRLNPEDPARFPDDWPQRIAEWKTRDYLLDLPLHRGFFLTFGVHDWRRFLEVIYLIGDDPGLVREIMDIHGEFAARLARHVLGQVDVDLVSFSEPIAGNYGSVIGPHTYRDLILPTYRPAIDAARAHGVETICLVTYANSRVLMPTILDAGFNCLWACEVNIQAMDYLALRRQFGTALRLIGGIDLDVLLLDRDAIRREMEAKIPPLLAQGGYVPLADGRVRPNVPFTHYRYYRHLLEKLTTP